MPRSPSLQRDGRPCRASPRSWRTARPGWGHPLPAETPLQPLPRGSGEQRDKLSPGCGFELQGFVNTEWRCLAEPRSSRPQGGQKRTTTPSVWLFGEWGATRRDTPHLLQAPLARACSFPKPCTPGNAHPLPPRRLHGEALGVGGPEPRGELNIQPDGGRRATPRTPLPGRWSRARWRGAGGGPGAARCARGRRGHGSLSPLPSPDSCAVWAGFQPRSRDSRPLAPRQDLPRVPRRRRAALLASALRPPTVHKVRVCLQRGGPWPLVCSP